MTEPHPWILCDRLAGGMTGLLVGDALGVPYEFHPPHDLPSTTQIEYTPPHSFARAHPSVAPGTWSDDGAQALVLLHSLLASDGLDLAHFSAGLVRWAHRGFCAVDDLVFDIGIQTSRAIANLAAGVPPEQAGPASERDNGNGSLMRVLPLALWHDGPDADLVRLAMQQSLPTHGHARSQLACAMYCLWVRTVMEGMEDAWDEAAQRLRALAAPLSLEHREVALILDPANAEVAKGSGYVVDTLWSARAALAGSVDFEDCLRRAVALGHDTDTTAAVAGGVAGVHYGLSGIPARWREGLRGEEILQPLLRALLSPHQRSRGAAEVPKTSVSHPLRIAELPVLNGAIGITFCPGKKQRGAISGEWDRDLDLDLAAIGAWGATDIVTLIEEHEMVELGVQTLGDRVRRVGPRWFHLPIVDQQPPDATFEATWDKLASQLVEGLNSGARILIHCKGGLGRAGTVAACLLLAAKPETGAEGAIGLVRKVRPGAIETRAQEQYVRRVARTIAATWPDGLPFGYSRPIDRT